MTLTIDGFEFEAAGAEADRQAAALHADLEASVAHGRELQVQLGATQRELEGAEAARAALELFLCNS